MKGYHRVDTLMQNHNVASKRFYLLNFIKIPWKSSTSTSRVAAALFMVLAQTTRDYVSAISIINPSPIVTNVCHCIILEYGNKHMTTVRCERFSQSCPIKTRVWWKKTCESWQTFLSTKTRASSATLQKQVELCEEFTVLRKPLIDRNALLM